MALLFRAGDHLNDLVDAAKTDESTDSEIRNEIIAGLTKYIPSEEDEAAQLEEVDFQPMGLDFSLDLPGDDEGESKFLITFKPKRGLYENGHEPLFLFKALAEFGTVDAHIESDGLPLFEILDPDESYLEWVINFSTTEEESRIHSVFEFELVLLNQNVGQATLKIPKIKVPLPKSQMRS